MRTLRALLPLLLLPGPLVAQEIVEVDSGPIEGELLDLDSALRVYRGVPFARAERWRAPRPVESWEEVRDARSFGAPCPQSPLIAMMVREALPATDEQCLTLNVWTTAQDEDVRLPVLVWIHGGGLVGGWSSQSLFDGAAFAREGVVFVSIGYRLGPLGYFAHPALAQESVGESGAGAGCNFGLLDQIAALEWVQRNVESFGGDPGRVTICGESAGATSVLALCASPLSRGLFHGAIAQSTWLTEWNFAPLAEAQEKGASYARRLLDRERADDAQALAALRALPADALWQGLGNGFEPVVAIDGHALEAHPIEVFEAGGQHDLPLIAGSTADEGTAFVPLLGYSSPEAFRAGLAEVFGENAGPVIELYAVDGPDALPGRIAEFIGDAWFQCTTRAMLRGMAQVPSSAWRYLFTRENAAMPALGAHHAVELPYVFHAVGDSAPEADRLLADRLLGYWVQFAKTGRPAGESLPEWPAWKPGDEAFLELGEEVRVGHGHRADACTLLEEALDR